MIKKEYGFKMSSEKVGTLMHRALGLKFGKIAEFQLAYQNNIRENINIENFINFLMYDIDNAERKYHKAIINDVCKLNNDELKIESTIKEWSNIITKVMADKILLMGMNESEQFKYFFKPEPKPTWNEMIRMYCK